jgi:hypothetical protein
MKGSTTLNSLELSNGKIGPAGAVAISEALKSNTRIIKLIISKFIKGQIDDNKLKDEGAISIAQSIENSSISELQMSIIVIKI